MCGIDLMSRYACVTIVTGIACVRGRGLLYKVIVALALVVMISSYFECVFNDGRISPNESSFGEVWATLLLHRLYRSFIPLHIPKMCIITSPFVNIYTPCNTYHTNTHTCNQHRISIHRIGSVHLDYMHTMCSNMCGYS